MLALNIIIVKNAQKSKVEFCYFNQKRETLFFVKKSLIFVFFCCIISLHSRESDTRTEKSGLKLTYSTIMFSSYFLLLKALGFSPGVFNFYLKKVIYSIAVYEMLFRKITDPFGRSEIYLDYYSKGDYNKTRGDYNGERPM